jgi:nicotinamide-nucleotide amidase
MPDDVSAKDLDFVRIDEGLVERAIAVLKGLRRQGRKVVSAESCTGGLIATVLSEALGAAEHFEGGFVVYTPEQKFFALKIPQESLSKKIAMTTFTSHVWLARLQEMSNATTGVSDRRRYGKGERGC